MADSIISALGTGIELLLILKKSNDRTTKLRETMYDTMCGYNSVLRVFQNKNGGRMFNPEFTTLMADFEKLVKDANIEIIRVGDKSYLKRMLKSAYKYEELLEYAFNKVVVKWEPLQMLVWDPENVFNDSVSTRKMIKALADDSRVRHLDASEQIKAMHAGLQATVEYEAGIHREMMDTIMKDVQLKTVSETAKLVAQGTQDVLKGVFECRQRISNELAALAAAIKDESSLAASRATESAAAAERMFDANIRMHKKASEAMATNHTAVMVSMSSLFSTTAGGFMVMRERFDKVTSAHEHIQNTLNANHGMVIGTFKASISSLNAKMDSLSEETARAMLKMLSMIESLQINQNRAMDIVLGVVKDFKEELKGLKEEIKHEIKQAFSVRDASSRCDSKMAEWSSLPVVELSSTSSSSSLDDCPEYSCELEYAINCEQNCHGKKLADCEGDCKHCGEAMYKCQASRIPGGECVYATPYKK